MLLDIFTRGAYDSARRAGKQMAWKNSQLGVALVGCGTVGGAVAQILTGEADILSGRLGGPVELRHIVDVDFANARRLGLDENLFHSDFNQVLDDPDVGVVVELIGGTDHAAKIIEQAIRGGRHVVTANKALLARQGARLCRLARDNGVSIGFEASCAGGIPVVRAISEGLVANRIDAIYGIVNGTCNYILTAMSRRGADYAQALTEAQNAGLAEADPTLDVSGGDSAHKLAILASLAFGQEIDFEAISVQGIDSLDRSDVAFGQDLGYVIKLLAVAQRQPEGISLRVRPAFITKGHPLAWVSGPFNAVSIYGHCTGHTMYYGRGAGGMPTASAVVADVAAVATGAAEALFRRLNVWPGCNPPGEQVPIGSVRSRYYLRITAEDRPGVLARFADVLGRHQISIKSVLQREPLEQEGNSPPGVPVVITTHRAVEGNVRNAIEEIDALDEIKAKTVCIGIVDEHPEEI